MTRLSAIGCTRLSDRSQVNGYGADVQANDIRHFAGQHGLVVAEIIDEVRSGATDLADRDVVQDYYLRARNTPGQPFIFPRVDRLGRLAELIIGIARQLIRYNAQVWVVGFDRPLDPKAPDWLMFQFRAMMAEQEYLSIMQRTMNAKIEKAEQGGWPSGRPPWGYRMVRNERGKATLPEPHPDRAPAVRRLFELRADLGSHETAQTLNREGWARPNNSTAWTRDAVRRIGRNAGYAGNWAFGAITLQIPPIVTPEMFEAVRRNSRERTLHRGPRADHLLSGVAYCAACGAAMSRVGTARSRLPDGALSRWYYRCWRVRSDRQKCTATGYFRQTDLEAMVWAAFVSTATDPEKLRTLLIEEAPGAPDLAGTEQQAELEAAIARAWEPYTRGVPGVTFEMAQDASRPYVEQKARLAQQQPVLMPVVDVEKVAGHLAELLHQTLTHEGQRAWLKTLHVKAYINRTGVDRITLDIPKV